MGGFARLPQSIISGSSGLIEVTLVPECQCPGAHGGNAHVCAKSERKLLVLLGPV
jgi:hypothetical protein